MNLLSLLYVSRSTLSPDTAADAVRAIVATSRTRNPRLGLTGALLFTGEHFAQVLEGPAGTVDRVMAEIARDPRHREVIVVARDRIAARRFGSWSMAYSGPSQFVALHVTRLLEDPPVLCKGQSAAWLNDLMWEFTEGPASR